MKILHRYILSLLLRNLLVSLLVFVFLFLVFDFFDRIDNILAEDASVFLVLQYFLFKVPLMLSLMFPVAMMVSILMTIGLLSKSSEITAMRASGVTIRALAMPVFISGFVLSLFGFVLNESVVPYAQRRSREIYNIDIRQKDKRGGFSQTDFWWRSGDKFIAVDTFDSRSKELLNLSTFELSDDFSVKKRTDAARVRWINPDLGWTMQGVVEYRFRREDSPNSSSLEVARFRSLPLPIRESPSEFYEFKTDPHTMTIHQLRGFIKRLAQNGLSISGQLPYLYEKYAFPFFNFIVTLVVLPFALRPARSGSMAASVIAGLVIGFSYYAVHSFSLAMGKAEILPPFLSAWLANLLIGFIGVVLLLGTESPN